MAGACCYIKFSNKLYTASDTQISLNINSTGAKAISLSFVTIRYGSAQVMYNYSPLTLRTAALPSPCLIIYDGSMYALGYSSYIYEDYSD